MRSLRKIINDGLEIGKTSGQIQPNHQKKKIPQPSMGSFSFGQAGFGLRKMH